ncbi:MAG: hypothetical protein B6244_05245 [Candidatus Cloacimonetes bacterium 4572_55]|nr:MAG: hypothetical protein B6244_05245 [Candidatus Cloacimonetes bacterium 4572_55]
MNDILKNTITTIILTIAVGTVLTVGYRLVTHAPEDLSENPFEYRLDGLENEDFGPPTYREIRQFEVKTNRLRALAVGRNDEIYVGVERAIFLFDKEGCLSDRIDLPATPSCIAVDDQGDMYLAIRNHVEIYDSIGTKKATWERYGDESILTSIAIKESLVFVADAGNRIVLKYDKKGLFLERIGGKNKDRHIPGFIIPSPYFDVAIDPDDYLWVVNPGRHSLEKYRDNGDLIASWGECSMQIRGFCGCCNPSHIAILSDGSFVTTEKRLVRVKRYNPVGELTAVVAGTDQFEKDTDGLDVAVNSKGEILLIDDKKKIVRIFAEIDGDQD